MIHDHTLEERVAERYTQLSGQLRKAADFVVSHPLEVATRSLRHISDKANVSPATFSRLSRSLGYDNFEEMKELSRRSVTEQLPSFSKRAEQLRADRTSGQSILARQGSACIANIRSLTEKTDPRKIDAAAKTLEHANRVLLFGALGSSGIVDYMTYLARYFAPNWMLAGRSGASLASGLAGLQQDDALLLVTKSPYAGRAVTLARLAREAGAEVVLLTDHHQCPAIEHATHVFIVPSESPQFFSSYAATLVLIEALVATIVASSEVDATAAIRRVEDNNHALGEYWAE